MDVSARLEPVLTVARESARQVDADVVADGRERRVQPIAPDVLGLHRRDGLLPCSRHQLDL